MFEIIMSQQNLGDVQLMFCKELFINRHEPWLPHRGARLQFRQVAGPLLVFQRAHPRAHRARGDQHDFLARLALLGHLPHQLFQLRQIRLLPAVCKDTGAELHDNSGNIC